MVPILANDNLSQDRRYLLSVRCANADMHILNTLLLQQGTWWMPDRQRGRVR